MALEIGSRLAHYDVTALIGEGGMGQVYQATDTKLNREVALKVLPEAFATDPDRLSRFQREAQVLASLNHPGIAAIYGIEEAEGTRALVLELVEGPTLADRIRQGPIPLDEALPIAKQIAEAVEAAHEAGVIHRDLKPANIKVRDDGTVKVLDFGLAKLHRSEQSQETDLTATTMATAPGLVLGTLPYMSPEQTRGHAVDRRTDIWAFGSVLYEMLTGNRAFPGTDSSDVLAKIIEREPDFTALPTGLPSPIRRLLRRCLDKDPRERLRDIGDARVEIREAMTVSVTEGVAAVPAMPHAVGWRRAMPWVAAAILASVVTGLAVWSLTRPDLMAPQPRAQFVVTTPPDGPLRLSVSHPDVAISPDGTRLVYMSGAGPIFGEQLYVRDLNQLVATPLPGTEGARNPFFSPDGEWLGFHDDRDGVIKRVSVSGGTPLPICDAASVRGVSWGLDDTIVFAPASGQGLLRVPAVGGDPEVLTRVDGGQRDVQHLWPEFLPGGKAVLFTIGTGGRIENQIAVLSLETGEQKLVLRGGSNPHYVPTGHIVYGVDGTVWAVPFDLDRLEVTGDRVPVLTDVITKDSGAANVAVSRDGTLLYVSAPGLTTQSELVLVDRGGRGTPLTEVTAGYYYPRFAPDGQRLAVSIAEVQGDITGSDADIWVLDLDRGTRTRLTFEGTNLVPTWAPDSSLRADGSGQPEALLVEDKNHWVTSWSRDGRMLAYAEDDPNADTGLAARGASDRR